MSDEELKKEEAAEAKVAEEEQQAAAAAAEEGAAEGTETPAEKTYADLGLDARFDGMSKEQLAGEIKHRNAVHGRQASEVGTLRKDLATAQAKLEGFAKAAGATVEVKEAVADMSDAELTRWLEDLQSNPRKAFKQILGDGMGRRSDDDLRKMFTKWFDEDIGQYHGYTQEQAAKTDPDYQVNEIYMEALRKPENFGNTRPAQELLAFAKFASGGADQGSIDTLFSCMKRFPEVPMKDCQHMVAGRTGGKATVDPNKIREQVKGLAGGTAASGAEKKSQKEEILTMDDAYDVPD